MPELTNRQLVAFAREVLGGYGCDEIGDIDGGDLQEIAHKHGLLLEFTVTEPCGDTCVCAESGDFPATCYRLHPTLTTECD